MPYMSQVRECDKENKLNVDELDIRMLKRVRKQKTKYLKMQKKSQNLTFQTRHTLSKHTERQKLEGKKRRKNYKNKPNAIEKILQKLKIHFEKK